MELRGLEEQSRKENLRQFPPTYFQPIDIIEQNLLLFPEISTPTSISFIITATK